MITDSYNKSAFTVFSAIFHQQNTVRFSCITNRTYKERILNFSISLINSLIYFYYEYIQKSAKYRENV